MSQLAMTPDKLKAFVADTIDEKLGATMKDFETFMAKTAAQSDAAIREEGQQTRDAAIADRLPGAWDPTDRSHPYVQRAGHLIRSDRIHVQRAGGARNVLAGGASESTYRASGSGLRLARLCRAYRAAEMEQTSVESILKGWGDEWMWKDLQAEKEARSDLATSKAWGYSNLATGGSMVPISYMMEMIELLRARNVVRSAGARQLPIPRGNLTMNRATSDGSSSYVGELGSVNVSDGATDQISLQARKLMSISAVSNELMRMADPAVDIYLRDAMLAQAANREDLAFIRGDGTSNTPTGLRYSAAAANITSTAGATLSNQLTDIQTLLVALAGSNVPMERPAFILPVRTLYALMFARDASGDGLLLRAEIANGTLFGIPFFTTTQIPVNLGGGTESEIYLADMSQVVVGDALTPVVEIFDNGAYLNSSGAMTSGISTDSTVIRMKQEHDIVLLHSEAAAIKTAVAY